MATPLCEVTNTINKLADRFGSGRLTHPRCRQRAEELLKLMEDVSWGRGGPDHYEAMQVLARALIDEGLEPSGIDTGNMVLEALTTHKEVFTSHIETSICPIG